MTSDTIFAWLRCEIGQMLAWELDEISLDLRYLVRLIFWRGFNTWIEC